MLLRKEKKKKETTIAVGSARQSWLKRKGGTKLVFRAINEIADNSIILDVGAGPGVQSRRYSLESAERPRDGFE